MNPAHDLPSAAFMARVLSALQVEDTRLTRKRRLPDGRLMSNLHKQWQASARHAARISKRIGQDVDPERSPHAREGGYMPTPMRPMSLTEFAEGSGVSRRVVDNWRSGRTRYPDRVMGILLNHEGIGMSEQERAYWTLALLGQYEGAGVWGDAVRAVAADLEPKPEGGEGGLFVD